MTAQRAAFVAIAVQTAVMLAGCGGQPSPPIRAPKELPTAAQPARLALRHTFVPGTAIVVCGERVDIGTPVVLWNDAIGYDAYSERCYSLNQVLPVELESRPVGTVSALRYGKRSALGLAAAAFKRVQASGWDMAALQERVHQFVIHYDAVGTSERCFRALHDRRGLSVHFMLDLDGTIWQTLDVRERAFHASQANDASVGVEIANIGAMSTPKLLAAWYHRDASGAVVITPPDEFHPGAQRRLDYVSRPARSELVSGSVQHSKFVQYDYTDAQYEALARLTAGLARTFPRLRLDVPRDSRGAVLTTVLSDADRTRFDGLLGHHHISAAKYDPGPAFDWPRLLTSAKALR